MSSFEGKVVVITGAARGQGEAEAHLFAARGAKVVLTDVLEEEGRAVADAIGSAAVFVPHDVADEAAWQRVVDAAIGEFGGIDVLVNNAAVFWAKPIVEETAAAFERAIRVNLIGPFLGIKAVIEPMRARGGGAIVNIVSTASMRGFTTLVSYGSAKWGLRGLTRYAAIELGDYRIRVNAVHPGAIDTPMMRAFGLEPGEGKLPDYPLRRAGLTDEVAELVAFVASDVASYITGADFTIDGGFMAGTPFPMSAVT